MKKQLVILSFASTLALSSCATILGGPITECQRTKPVPGAPSRAIRPAALIFDIILSGVVGVAVDFATCAIYRPCATAGAANYKRVSK